MKNLETVELSEIERISLDHAYRILKDLKKSLRGKALYSTATGQIICSEDIPPILGALDGLVNTENWTAIGTK